MWHSSNPYIVFLHKITTSFTTSILVWFLLKERSIFLDLSGILDKNASFCVPPFNQNLIHSRECRIFKVQIEHWDHHTLSEYWIHFTLGILLDYNFWLVTCEKYLQLLIIYSTYDRVKKVKIKGSLRNTEERLILLKVVF